MENIIKGIKTGKNVFSGPHQVIIDITNKCNCNCSACWIYSPFIKNENVLMKQEIEFYRLLDLIDELAEMNVNSIRFSGGGEPLIYDGVVEIIEAVKQYNMKCSITTNFTKITREMIDRFIFWEVDEIAISLWAATSKIYSLTHPNRSEENFNWITELIKYLVNNKKDKKPELTISNVIYSENFNELEKMYDYALENKVDAVYFTLADIIERSTEHLLLTNEQCKKILDVFRNILKRSEKDNIKIENADGFIKRLLSPNAYKGIYDKIEIDSIPCYAGWAFSRILANGDVVPCCRGVEKVMGNINNSSFSEIWNSDKYNKFRRNALYKKKSDKYFKEIGCYKSCDNLMHNREIYKIITGNK